MNKEQKIFLRTRAHKLKPIIWIGPAGLSDNIISEIRGALLHHELIKIKVRTDDRERRDQVINSICDLTGAELVQKIGNSITIYQSSPKQP